MQSNIWIVLALSGLALTGTRYARSAQEKSDAKIIVTQHVYDIQQLIAKTQLPEPVLRGRALWMQRCAYCHDGVGTPTYRTLGPWIDADTVRTAEGEAFARKQIANGSGRMPGFRYSLQVEQVDYLIAFLKSVTPDQRPTAEELAKSPPSEAPTQ